MIVYSVFKIFGEGDGYKVSKLLKIFKDIEKAKDYTKSKFIEIERESLKIQEDNKRAELAEEEEIAKKGYSRIPSAKDTEVKFRMDLVHSDMKEDNGYTYVGKISDTDIYCNYGSFGGFIIQPTEVIE